MPMPGFRTHSSRSPVARPSAQPEASMPRHPHRYGLSRRASKLPALAGAPIFIDRLPPWARRAVRGRPSLRRAALVTPSEIARHRGRALVERVAVDGGATEGDLAALGW